MRLEAIETLIPEARIEVAQIIGEAGGLPDESRAFTGLFGMRSVAAADPAIGAAGYLMTLLDRLAIVPSLNGPKILIHAHSLPIVKGRMPSLESLRKHPALTDLDDILDMDQFNCAGMFHAMEAAQYFLSSGMIAEALIFAGDCLSDWPLATRYIPSCTVLGDGYVLLRLTARSGGVQIGPIATRHYPGFEGGIDGGAQQMDSYNRAHFGIIADILQAAAHSAIDDSIFPHNINGLAWRLYCRQTGHPSTAVHTALVPQIGHCCNADPFLVLAHALNSGPVKGTLLSVGMAGFAGAAPVSGALYPQLA
jgi:3-oxoacyl-[acyl-carrier-protein] synthase-3